MSSLAISSEPHRRWQPVLAGSDDRFADGVLTETEAPGGGFFDHVSASQVFAAELKCLNVVENGADNGS